MDGLFTKTLEEQKSTFNGRLSVVKTLGMGTYIQSNGLTQSGGIVEAIWRQTLRVVNSKSLYVKNCLVLGLGGGTVAKIIRKKWPGANITGIEIDPVIVALGKKYLDMDKIGVDIKITDAFKFLKHESLRINHYDLIVVDLYNGDLFPKQFENGRCIELVKDVLQENGVAIFNRLYFGDKRPLTVKFGRLLEKMFSKVDWFYPEANLMFICSGSKHKISGSEPE